MNIYYTLVSIHFGVYMLKKLTNPRVFISGQLNNERFYACDCSKSHKIIYDNSFSMIKVNSVYTASCNILKYECASVIHYVVIDKSVEIKTTEYINWLQKNGLSIDDIEDKNQISIMSVKKISNPTYVFDLRDLPYGQILEEKLINLINYIVDHHDEYFSDESSINNLSNYITNICLINIVVNHYLGSYRLTSNNMVIQIDLDYIYIYQVRFLIID